MFYDSIIFITVIKTQITALYADKIVHLGSFSGQIELHRDTGYPLQFVSRKKVLDIQANISSPGIR